MDTDTHTLIIDGLDDFEAEHISKILSEYKQNMLEAKLEAISANDENRVIWIEKHLVWHENIMQRISWRWHGKMNETLIKKLKQLASSECFFDDEDENVTVDDYSGGNQDDAFNIGNHAGEVMLARDILNHKGISWKE